MSPIFINKKDLLNVTDFFDFFLSEKNYFAELLNYCIL